MKLYAPLQAGEVALVGAVPAMAGIPVTDLHVNALLAFLAGHEADAERGCLRGVSPSIVVIGDVVNERREWRSIA